MLALAQASRASLPPFSASQIYSQNTFVSGSKITFPFNSGNYGGPGFLGMAIGNAGRAYVHVALFADPPPPLPGSSIFQNSNQAVLDTGGSGADTTPYLFGGAGYDEFSDGPGSVTAPSTDYIFDEAFWTSMNNNGVSAISLRLGATATMVVAPITGVYVGDGVGGSFQAMPVKEGDVITASGVAPGTVFAAFGPDRIARYGSGAPLTGMAQINDQNVLLIAGNIVEGGVTKKAIIKAALGPTGALLSETLVAKEGGLVGAGPDTWATLATTPNTCAMNNAGQVIFSGTTSAGGDGIFLANANGTGGFVAMRGGSAPGGGTWGQLSGAPVDLNRGGHFVFRGVPQGNGTWNEVADAGETFSTGLSYTANGTTGGGPLSVISGSLSNDFDVDVYYISIGDPTLTTQVPFSATTVPDPGSGFAGAAFDTVLWLFSDAPNCNGVTRVGLGRNDDAAAGVAQSTLTAASLRSSHTPGTKYFLAISTPKARATGESGDVWRAVPDRLAIAGGIAYWVDPGHGQIGRADVGTGAALAPLTVGSAPTAGVGSPTSPPYLDTLLAVSNSQIFFHQLGSPDAFRTCALDGSGVASLTLSSLSSANTTAMAYDGTNAKLYWATRANPWRINRCDPDGNNAETVYTGTGYDLIQSLAVDSANGKVYWSDATANMIARMNLDGSGAETVLTPAAARSMAVDSSAHRLYYASSASNKIGVVDTSTPSALADLIATASPVGIALDSSAGRVYWSNPYERTILRTLIATPSAETWFSLGQDLGERLSDGPADVDCAGVSGFTRYGAAGSTSLPYQIKLTGATFANQAAMLCRDNTTKVVLGGEGLASTGGAPVTVVAAPEGPVRISDRGLVAWRGRWVSGGTRTGLFLGTDKVFDDTGALGAPETGVGNMDMSSSGQYLMTSTFNGSFTNPGNFCVRVSFASIPGCAADYNLSGGLEVQDIFDFLNGWFAGSPAADFNANGVLEVQDIFDFLNAWFAGCS
jgi:hypothetical protein